MFDPSESEDHMIPVGWLIKQARDISFLNLKIHNVLKGVLDTMGRVVTEGMHILYGAKVRQILHF